MTAKIKVNGTTFLGPSSRVYFPLRWALLIFMGLAIYGQTFGYDFVFDDNFYILNTPYIRSLDNINQIWAFLPWTRSLGVYSFFINYQIGGFHPQGYHIFNFLIHLCATGLVWALAGLLFKIVTPPPLSIKSLKGKMRHKENPQITIDKDLPFVIALFFLVHPCQTQAVSYISQRFESMATVFYLASVYCYLQGRICSFSKQRAIWLFSTAGFAVLGILTKEVAVTIPLMLLAIEFIFFNNPSLPFRRSRSRQLYFSVAFISVVFVLLFMKMVRTDFINIYFHFNGQSASYEGDLITGGKYVLTQMRVFLTFLRLLVLPIHQNVDYDYPLSTGLFTPPLTLVGLCVIAFIGYLIYRLRQGWPLIAFGLAWLLVTFSVNTAPRVNVIFEHKIYLISFGFFLAGVCALSILIKDRRILFGLLATLIALLAVVSYHRNQVWRSEFTLWEDVAHKSPHKARAYNALGVFYGKRGDYPQALSLLNQAIAMNAHYAEAYNNRGNVYLKEGNDIKALLDLNKAIEINPAYAQAYTNRGIIYFKEGKLDQALADYDKAIDLDVYNVDAYYHRGLFYEAQGLWSQALDDYTKAIDINPDFEDALDSRGFLFVRQGHCVQAMPDFDKAIQINPLRVELFANRGACYAQQGEFNEALLDYGQAIALNPQYPEVYYNRSVTYFQLKDYDRAWEDLREARTLGAIISPKFISALKQASAQGTVR